MGEQASPPGGRVVARESKSARASVGRTRFACVPCILTPQSLQSAHSYEKSPKMSERYEFGGMPRKILSHTRLLPVLRHKGRFAYECASREALTRQWGPPMEPVAGSNTRLNFGDIRDPYINNRVLLE